MKLTPAQSEIAKDKHRFKVINCGRRFGKTSLAVEAMKAKAVQKGGRRIAYIATTYQQARDISWEMLKKSCGEAIINANESRLELTLGSIDGEPSQIILRGWESVETLRGQGFDMLVLDEVASMRNFWLGWHEVLRPTLTSTQGSGYFISTPQGYNHFYDLYNQQVIDKDYKSFHFTTYDNPTIDKEEVDKAKLELTSDRFAQEYMADFRKTEGLVYPEFVREWHLTGERPREVIERIAGVDFGYTNPSAILTIDRDALGVYWVQKEYYKTGKTNIELIEYLKQEQPHVVYPDSAEPDRIQEMKSHGLNVREINKDVISGIDKVRELFKANRIKINENCINLVNEIETYSYPNKKTNRNPNELPIPENNHAMDALRYALVMNDRIRVDSSAKQFKPENVFIYN